MIDDVAIRGRVITDTLSLDHSWNVSSLDNPFVNNINNYKIETNYIGSKKTVAWLFFNKLF